jgi:hypothetical protein
MELVIDVELAGAFQGVAMLAMIHRFAPERVGGMLPSLIGVDVGPRGNLRELAEIAVLSSFIA